jgi:hypothetical protein
MKHFRGFALAPIAEGDGGPQQWHGEQGWPRDTEKERIRVSRQKLKNDGQGEVKQNQRKGEDPAQPARIFAKKQDRAHTDRRQIGGWSPGSGPPANFRLGGAFPAQPFQRDKNVHKLCRRQHPKGYCQEQRERLARAHADIPEQQGDQSAG